MGQRSVPAPFLSKTYEMVDDGRTDDVISWGDKGFTFVVWNTVEFAKELLPKYFKHNNFSSFVRQLNTYGFRKIVADKWEFANVNFKRGQKELLGEIRRRKTTMLPVKTTVEDSSVSGEAGSSSTSSPEQNNQGALPHEIADLSGENEKLRSANEKLSQELAQARKQCEELTTLLTGRLKVGPHKINEILVGPPANGVVVGDVESYKGEVYASECDDDEKEKEKEKKMEEEDGLKLFGVWLKEGKKKRGCCENENNNNMGLCGVQSSGKLIKTR